MDTKPAPIIPAAEEKSITQSQSGSEDSTKLKKRFWAQRWVTPVATALLTALFAGFTSAFVTIFTLWSEHSFASRQKLEERQQKLIDEKVRLTGEAARLSGQLLGIRRQSALDTLETELAGTTGLQSYKNDQQIPAVSFSELEKAKNAQREDITRLFSTGAELQSVLKISSIHFGSKTQEAIRRLTTITLPVQPFVNPEASMSEVYSRYTTQLTEDEYAKSVYEVIDTMASEVASEFTSK
jgi:hypothetical protein